MRKIDRIKAFISDNVYEVTDLVTLLELTIEDIMERHPDSLLDNAHKFGDFDAEQDAEDEFDDEEPEEEEGHYSGEWEE